MEVFPNHTYRLAHAGQNSLQSESRLKLFRECPVAQGRAPYSREAQRQPPRRMAGTGQPRQPATELLIRHPSATPSPAREASPAPNPVAPTPVAPAPTPPPEPAIPVAPDARTEQQVHMPAPQADDPRDLRRSGRSRQPPKRWADYMCLTAHGYNPVGDSRIHHQQGIAQDNEKVWNSHEIREKENPGCHGWPHGVSIPESSECQACDPFPPPGTRYTRTRR